MVAQLTVRLLGRPDIRIGDDPVTQVHSRKEAWVLALLILRYPRPVERDWLAGTL